jgi:adenosine kinase
MADKTKILVIGSLAYDNVMKFDGLFKDLTIPGQYNMAITTKGRTISFGGCGGNIAYSLNLLQEDPVLMTVAGNDFEQYKGWLISKGLDLSSVYISDKYLTAAAFIVTDKDENQITMFDSGALGQVKTSQNVKMTNYGAMALAVISPDNPEKMIAAAKECKDLGIPFLFAPAQVTPYIKVPDLNWAITNAGVVVVNDYEAEMAARLLGTAKTALPMMAQCYVETHGSKGCSVMSKAEGTFYVRSVQPSKLVDPTGCGDAFIAGLAGGLRRKLPIQKCCQAGALLSTYNLEQQGTQTHTFTLDEFNQRFENNFGETIF